MIRVFKYVVIMLGVVLLVEPCIASTPEIISVSAGKGAFSLAVMDDGTVWAWGNNHHGQVGDGSSGNDRYVPAAVAISNVTAVSGGLLHTVVLKDDGTVWEWGHTNFYQNQRPDYNTTLATFPPIKIQIEEVLKVSAGDSYTLALRKNGTVWAWGDNYYGELGDGTTNSSWAVQVAGLDNVKDIHAGYGYSMALDNNGSVWEWGRIYKGHENNEYATPITYNVLAPVQVPISNVTAISSGRFFSLALKDDGTVWAWGRNIGCQLGDGTTDDSLAPIMVSGLKNIVAISGGETASMALDKDGTVWAWGASAESFGNGDTSAKTYSTPVRVSISDVRVVSFSGIHALALKNDGTLWAWGQSGNGELGNSSIGTLYSAGYPVLVDIPQNQNIGAGQGSNTATAEPVGNSSSANGLDYAKIIGLVILAIVVIGTVYYVILKKK